MGSLSLPASKEFEDALRGGSQLSYPPSWKRKEYSFRMCATTGGKILSSHVQGATLNRHGNGVTLPRHDISRKFGH